MPTFESDDPFQEALNAERERLTTAIQEATERRDAAQSELDKLIIRQRKIEAFDQADQPPAPKRERAPSGKKGEKQGQILDIIRKQPRIDTLGICAKLGIPKEDERGISQVRAALFQLGPSKKGLIETEGKGKYVISGKQADLIEQQESAEEKEAAE